MSGPKISAYELERQRQQKLREALKARKEAYCCAIRVHHDLLKQVQVSSKILESKRETLKSAKEKTNNQTIASAYQRQIDEIERILPDFKNILEESIPEMDDITESESTRCVQADYIRAHTEVSKNKFNRLLTDYNKVEKQAEDDIEKERQRIEYIRAKTELEAQRAKCNEAIQQFAGKLKGIISSQEAVSGVENAVSEIECVRASLLDDANKLLCRSVPGQTEEVRKLTAKTMRESEDLIHMANHKIQESLERIKCFTASKEKVSRMLDHFDAQQKRAALSKALTEIDDVHYAEYKEPDYYKTLEENARKELDSLLDRIEDAVCDDSVCQEDTQRLERIYLNIQETAEHSRKSLAVEIIQAKDILAQVKQRAEDFEQCYCKYATACEMLNQLYTANGEEHKKIEVQERLDYVSVDALCDEERRISGILDLENERYFIRKTINEVMREFGYSMAEEFVLHRGQRGTHLLCKKENGDTAIHVHYGNGAKKRIMLEVVGVKKTSRDNLDEGVDGQIIGPDALSETRRQELLEKQTAFCQIHPEIIKALKVKGILTSAIELNPPRIEFCEEIAIIDKTAGTEHTLIVGKDEDRNRRRKRETPKSMEERMGKRKF